MNIKHLIILSGLSLGLAACNSAKDNQANQLLNEADSLITTNEYAKALEVLDTLEARYPENVDCKRKAMHLRPLAQEGLTVKEIQTNDSLLAYYKHVKDSLTDMFTFVDNPQLVEGYYVIKEYANSTLFSRNGVEARITPEGEFYMISSLVSQPVKHTSVSLSNAKGEASTAVVDYDGERNYRYGNTEMITFTGAECDTLGAFLTANPGVKTNLVFKGAKNVTYPLSANDRKSIELSYIMAKALSQERFLTRKHEYLDRQLILARDQAARTSGQEN